MVAKDTLREFSLRLNRALDAVGYIHGTGRRAQLARDMRVSGEAARKWLSGETLPAMKNLRRLAVLARIDADHLLTGRTQSDRTAETAGVYATGEVVLRDPQELRLLRAYRNLDAKQQVALVTFLEASSA